MKARVALLGLVAGPLFAWGQPFEKNGIEIRVRPWGDTDPTHWVSSGTFASELPATPMQFEVQCYYYRAQGYGLSSVVHNIIGSPYSALGGDSVQVIDRADSSLHPDGRMGNFNNGGQFQVVYHTGTTGVDANRFRIAASGNAGDASAGGISVKQQTPVSLGTNFDIRNGFAAYHFKLSLARPVIGHTRTVVVDAPLNRINAFRIYDSSSSTTSSNVTPVSATIPATITVQWCEPDILLQIPPTDQALSVGQPSTFMVVAVGEDLHYRWRRNGQILANDGRISGADTYTLTISEAQCEDIGDYDCLLTDTCGTISSGTASLVPDIQITQPPNDQALLPGQIASLSVQATGTNLQFQWRKGGIDLQDGDRLSGVQTPILTINNAQCGDAGLYDCIVSDACGALASPVARLIGEPVILVQPGGTWWLQSGMELEVGVPPGAPYQYRWRRNGQDLVNIPGLFAGVTTKDDNDPVDRSIGPGGL